VPARRRRRRRRRRRQIKKTKLYLLRPKPCFMEVCPRKRFTRL